MTTPPSFDDLTPIYDALIDWPKRLSHETPFYQRWFAAAQVKRLLDAACGTGRHAGLFHSWGLEVQGSDLSPRMIAAATAALGTPPGLSWAVRGFDQPIPLPSGPFDAIVCVGNSLALAPDLATVEQAIRQMLAAAKPNGGLLILHVLNLWALPDGPCIWQKSRRTSLPSAPGSGADALVGSSVWPAGQNADEGVGTTSEVLIIKGVHRSGSHGYVELLIAPLDGPPDLRHETVRFLGLEAPDLERCARSAGAQDVQFFGGYQDQPYQRDKSSDMIAVIRK
ncbi:MAG: class I SAM-dependent methyltransferase [Phycisphaerae bacterium]